MPRALVQGRQLCILSTTSSRARALRALAGQPASTKQNCIRPQNPVRVQKPIFSLQSPTYHTSASTRMASDEDYAAFLDKANQDTGASNPSVQAKSVGTKAVNTEVPQALQQVEEYYTSEADEPFEPVSLKWAGDKIPSESEFRTASWFHICKFSTSPAVATA